MVHILNTSQLHVQSCCEPSLSHQTGTDKRFITMKEATRSTSMKYYIDELHKVNIVIKQIQLQYKMRSKHRLK